MYNMRIICLCNASSGCILFSVEASHRNQEGARIMKNNEFGVVRQDKYALPYVGGVPVAEKRFFWNQSPWDAFRLLLREA